MNLTAACALDRVPTGYRAGLASCGMSTMEKHGEEIEVTETEASGGVKHHNVRVMLGISLLLVIVVLSAIWMTGAAVT